MSSWEELLSEQAARDDRPKTTADVQQMTKKLIRAGAEVGKHVRYLIDLSSSVSTARDQRPENSWYAEWQPMGQEIWWHGLAGRTFESQRGQTLEKGTSTRVAQDTAICRHAVPRGTCVHRPLTSQPNLLFACSRYAFSSLWQHVQCTVHAAMQQLSG